MAAGSVLRIPIPNPFFESATNVYCIAAEPLTLIDTGIGLDEAYRTLEEGLRSHGVALEGIEQVVLTHKHPDHVGLASRIRERSGARVFVHEEDRADVIEFEERHGKFVELTQRRLRAFGTPESIVESLPALFERGGRLARSTPAEPLADGDRLTVGGVDLEVLHTPGHTQGAVCLRYDRYLFTGDHLLPDYTPNIGGGEVRHSGMLGRYLESLERVRAFAGPGCEVLPGHGEPIEDLDALIQRSIEHHHQRADALLKILSDGRPQTVFELADSLFGELEGYHVVLGTGEVHAHLEVLEEQGRVVKENGRFATT